MEDVCSYFSIKSYLQDLQYISPTCLVLAES